MPYLAIATRAALGGVGGRAGVRRRLVAASGHAAPVVVVVVVIIVVVLCIGISFVQMLLVGKIIK